jgi:4-alpha-glucanotransferase
MNRRTAGILLHVTSLPSPFGIGDLGPGAHGFLDVLADAGFELWQVLPLGPTETAHDSCPYFSHSAFAGNTLLISPELMVEQGLLSRRDLPDPPDLPASRVDYEAAARCKEALFDAAFRSFREAGGEEDADYRGFTRRHAHWLDDFALFAVLKRRHRARWTQWPAPDRDGPSPGAAAGRLDEEVARERFLQWVFFSQWNALRRACNERNVHLMGDLPIYVTHDSADVWSHRGMFKLDEAGLPRYVAGVPPDYFSETGQLWGNPVYDWEALERDGYGWWMRRVAHNLDLYDFVRVDHFRGFVGYWQVPAGEETAVNGEWIEAPAEDFFDRLARRFPSLPIVAEDLGTITADVREVMRTYGLPGMKVLLFAFGDEGAANPYLPHNHDRGYVVYTGTHDNNTARGWFEREATEEQRHRLSRYLGKEPCADEVHRDLVRMALMSVADTAVVPLQDVLGLDERARMNRPAGGGGNWRWRVTQEQLDGLPVGELREMLELYGRTPSGGSTTGRR